MNSGRSRGGAKVKILDVSSDKLCIFRYSGIEEYLHHSEFSCARRYFARIVNAVTSSCATNSIGLDTILDLRTVVSRVTQPIKRLLMGMNGSKSLCLNKTNQFLKFCLLPMFPIRPRHGRRVGEGVARLINVEHRSSK